MGHDRPLLLDETATVWSVPEEQRPALPLVIVMHGRGSDENDLAALFSELPAEFAYASVRAPIEEGPGWSWFEAGGRQRSGDPTPENADRAGRRRARLARRARLGSAARRHPRLLAGRRDVDARAAPRSRPRALRRQPGRLRRPRARSPPTTLSPSRKPAGVLGARRRGRAVHAGRCVERTAPWLEAHADAETHVYPGLGHSHLAGGARRCRRLSFARGSPGSIRG